ncbi:MAG: DUF2442 domain-containing protein [Ideonella sp.]|nr:DUF2442 domain-containing protein [Ideonella sp.]MBE7427096.1 DUF2442 domain-containing protein [Ideonella sp.]MCC7457736.1 DUF2442 domain-containing protein [Nitrospira sp.]
MDTPRLIGVRAEADFKLHLTFASGETRTFDCTPYLHRGVFTRLRDPALFAQVHVQADTACWPGGLDIAPETLFLRSVPTTQVTASSA